MARLLLDEEKRWIGLDVKIYCDRCNKSLGEIFKSRLLKNVVHLCKECNNKAKIAESVMGAKPETFDFLKALGLSK